MAGNSDKPEKMRPIFKGEVLLCEDNEINQHVFKSHVSQLGLYIVVAQNGKEGVAQVAGRMEKGRKPFDLIFMDIQMPVMDGLEASGELAKLGNKTPIVALSANAGEEDKQKYKEHGMHGTLNKPFTVEELWALLHNYFTPQGYEPVSGEEALSDEEKRRKKLYTSFVVKNTSAFSDISCALKAGDIKLAHRLAHTLRGLAGLMEKPGLQESARAVELLLADGNADNLSNEHMEKLREELDVVLEELAPYIVKGPEKERVLNKENAAALFGRLEPLLAGYDASCQELTDELRDVPETDSLISHIEEYEFELALEELIVLRKTLGV